MKDTPSRALRAALLTATIAIAGTASYAVAQTPPATAAAPANFLSLSEIESRLTADGLKVEEIEIRDAVVEVEAYDANGREVDLVIDRRTGETLSRKFDD